MTSMIIERMSIIKTEEVEEKDPPDIVKVETGLPGKVEKDFRGIGDLLTLEVGVIVLKDLGEIRDLRLHLIST